MYRLLYFIRKTYVAIIFIVLEIVAIRAYAYSTPYTQSRLLAFSNSVFGGLYKAFGDVSYYFSLRKENVRLTARIAELEHRLDICREMLPVQTDSVAEMMHQYEYIAAGVIANSINHPQNFITIDKGINNGVRTEMAVLSPEGYVVGYVVNCSDNFAVAMTLLNTDMRTSGRLATDGNSGLVRWQGGDSAVADFDEVSKYADIKEGDMVVTTGFSHYFPEGLTIGSIESFSLNASQTTYKARVRLAADIARLRNVVLVNNTAADEVRDLESKPKPAWGAE